MTTTVKRWYWWAPVICLLVPLIGYPFSEWHATSQWGTKYGNFGFGYMLMLPMMAALPGLVIGALGLAVARLRPVSFLILLCSAGYVAGTIQGMSWAGSIRMEAFERLAERSKPLVAAIHAFNHETGRPPESLEDLIPRFISTVPTTGMGAYPKYEYFTGTNAVHFDGNPWVLKVFTPAGGINFDSFLYFPLQNYPKHGYGGVLQRIGDWAYVHE